jgi:hypothetical protein
MGTTLQCQHCGEYQLGFPTHCRKCGKRLVGQRVDYAPKWGAAWLRSFAVAVIIAGIVAVIVLSGRLLTG